MRSTSSDSKRDLWIRLRDYHFEHLVPPHLINKVAEKFVGTAASTRAFADKVARKLGWERGFALRAVAEYRRFVYLGVVSDFYVTPPRAIDQVWHEHLLFTRGYRDFCRDVLRCEFDHAPELVPTNEQTRVFQAQYEATLDRYQEEFHAEPPADIWRTPKFRFEQPLAPSSEVKRDRPTSYGDDTPLYSMFSDWTSGGATTDGADGAFAGFGHGGGFSGGGSSGSWGGGASSHHGSHGHGASTHSDSSSAGHGGHGGSDSGGGGSDSGGGSDGGGSDSGGGGADGGGSGCSSGCGGGGCGGS